MKKLWTRVAAAAGSAALALLVAGTVGCSKPTVTLEVTASHQDGAPLGGVSVDVDGQNKGVTKDDGKLQVALLGPEPGSELVVKASLERPGVRFSPVEQKVIVRRYEASKPETLNLPVALTMEVVEASSEIAVESAGMPVAG